MHTPPRDAILPVTKVAGVAMNIMSGQRVDPAQAAGRSERGPRGAVHQQAASGG